VIIPKRRAVGLTYVAGKASAGAIEYVPVARVANLVQAIAALKEHGIWVAGTEAGAGEDFYKADLSGPLAVVVGGEGEGMGRLTAEACDFIVRIPLAGHVNSLNASVACGIVLYEAFRQRREKGAGK
jgi:23S rRNA (guanosine2251-2'-O)-methyltransferase